MARRDRQGIPVYYASREGVRFDGSDQSSAVQAILDRGASGPMKLILDGSFTAKALKIHSNTTVEGLGNGTVVTLFPALDMHDGYMFGNANWRSTFPSATPIVDHDIVLRNLKIDGNKRSGIATGPGGSLNSTSDGCGVTGTKFYGVNNLLIENVYVYDPPAYSIHVANIFNSTIRNITGIVPSALTATVFNQAEGGTDIVHVNGPASDLLIENIHGANYDDFVALNAVDGNVTTHVRDNWEMFYCGPITRVVVRDLFPRPSGNVVRLLSSIAPPNSGPSCPIDQVLVENVVGSSWSHGFVEKEYHDATVGYLGTPQIGHVALRNWNLHLMDDQGPSWIGGNVKSFTISGFRLGNRAVSSTAGVTYAELWIDHDANIGRLVIDDWVMREDASELSTTQPLFVMNLGGTIDEFVLSNVNFSRNAATDTSLADLSNGTINRIELRNVSVNNVAHVVNIAGANVGGISTTGLTHRGATGGSASINVASGTVSRLRAAGSDTALLASGTIASTKTDATEG